MDKTDEQLASLIEKLQDAGFTQAPEVIDGTLRAIYADGIVSLVFLGLFAAMFLAALILSVYGAVNNIKKLPELGAIAALISFLFTIIFSTDNPWLKVFDPQASFYQQLVEKLL